MGPKPRSDSKFNLDFGSVFRINKKQKIEKPINNQSSMINFKVKANQLALTLLFFFFLVGINLAQRPVQKYGDLYVSGKYLKSAKTGENVTLRSLSLSWSNWC